MNIIKNSFIAGAFHKIGMDGAIAYSSAARIFQAFAGVISVFFIAAFLTGDEQGYYYTFGSILAIQTFFELGFTDVITQYVAHEVAHLNLNNHLTYEGEEKYHSRLTYLIKFCMKWYLVIAVAFFIVVNIVGIVFFSSYGKEGSEVDWKLPWLILSFSTALKLLQSPFSAIFNGLGRVKDMMQISFYQQLILPISQWIMFACGLKLYVVGISSMLGVLVWFVFVYKSDLKDLFINLLKGEITERISYFKEIFPFQWRIALSWISGYFIFQLFNPVLFATEGAVVAGQMGMTLTILSAIQSFSMSWQNTKIPKYSGLIELKEYKELDRLFSKTIKQMIMICLFLLSGMFLVVFILKETYVSLRGSVIGDRFLGYLPMVLMMLPLLANMFVFSWATYLRCHKQEPFLVNSIVMGILCCLSTLSLGNYFGLYGITVGYCLLTLFVALPWSYRIFVNKKIEWHE